MPCALLNTYECCRQSSQHYIQEEEGYMFQLKMLSCFQAPTTRIQKGGVFTTVFQV